MPSVEVDVDVGYITVNVELNDINTEDLIKELESRNVKVLDGSDTGAKLDELYYSIRDDNKEKVYSLVREIIFSANGRVI